MRARRGVEVASQPAKKITKGRTNRRFLARLAIHVHETRRWAVTRKP